MASHTLGDINIDRNCQDWQCASHIAYNWQP